MTFSIVACDPDAQAWGVAVASKFLAVGAVVPWARAGVGAVATQAFANFEYGPDGLARLAKGASADEVVRALTERDASRKDRQVGVVDAEGNAATFTGEDCFPWAGGRRGKHYAVQGNILAGPEVADAMARAFEDADGDLPTRLLAALAAGDAEGGDARGKQSAALFVTRPNAGYGGNNDRWVDLRVDDHPEPVVRLAELLDLWRLYFSDITEPPLTVEGEVKRDLERLMLRRGHLVEGEALDADSFTRFLHAENFEARTYENELKIDPGVLRWVRRQLDEEP